MGLPMHFDGKSVSLKVVNGLLGSFAVFVGTGSRDAINNSSITDLGASVGIAKYSVGVVANRRAGTGVSG